MPWNRDSLPGRLRSYAESLVAFATEARREQST